MPYRFAFLTPVYKTEYLKDSLSSIKRQTFEDFEVLVSDDCSPYGVKSIVEPFLSDYRFSYCRNESNIGARNLVMHWNRLLNKCEAEFVVIASDDDIYDSSFLDSINNEIKKNPYQDIYRVGAKIIDNEGNVIKTERVNGGVVSTVDFINHLLSQESVLCIGNYVFRTRVLKESGGFVQFPYGWKSDTATQLLLSKNGIVMCDKNLFSFRMSGLNISSQISRHDESNKMKLKALLSFEEWLQSFISDNCFDSCRDSILKDVRHRLEGETRSYYFSLSLSEFSALFIKFLREGWFASLRNMISFMAFRIRR